MAVKKNQRPVLERFMDRVEVRDGCWEWRGVTLNGYGRFHWGWTGRQIAHRWLWEQLNGPLADGLMLDHLCGNRPCVRLDHLEPVTAAENTHRGHTGDNSRLKTACPAGHPYNEANTYRPPGRKANRMCATCNLERGRRPRPNRIRRKAIK